MTDVKLPYSLKVYRVEKVKLLQSHGQEAQLTIAKNGFTLISQAGAAKKITPKNVIKVDLNNVLSKEYFVIYTNSEKIILTFHQPHTLGQSLKSSIENRHNPINAINSLEEGMTATWIKQAVNQIVTTEKIVQRKELRLGLVIAIGITIPVLLVLAFLLYIKLYIN